jgi:hypothetical protein
MEHGDRHALARRALVQSLWAWAEARKGARPDHADVPSNRGTSGLGSLCPPRHHTGLPFRKGRRSASRRRPSPPASRSVTSRHHSHRCQDPCFAATHDRLHPACAITVDHETAAECHHGHITEHAAPTSGSAYDLVGLAGTRPPPHHGPERGDAVCADRDLGLVCSRPDQSSVRGNRDARAVMSRWESR